MPSPVAFYSRAMSATGNLAYAHGELPIAGLFDVRNDAYASFKTDSYKVRYSVKPGIGATAFVARRNHPGSGIARLWRRVRDLCSVSASEQRMRRSTEIHLSLGRSDLKKAYECIGDLLTLDSSPFDDFKAIKPDMMGAHNCMDEGAQITLYVHDQTDLGRAASFLTILGKRLVENDVRVGTIPSSDTPLSLDGHLAFFSYRNEDLTLRGGEIPPLQAMKDFYRSVGDLPREG